jgi:methylthioribose-1-phosphate isomerase
VVKNFGFDVTPAKFVTGLITERGVCQASREGLLGLFPERDWRLKTVGANA